MNIPTRIAVIGGGAWGTALALTARRAGAGAVLWVRAPELALAMRRACENPAYLPGIALDPEIAVVSDFAELGPVDLALLAVPAQAVRAIGAALSSHLPPGVPVVVAAKGIEAGSFATMPEVAMAVLRCHPSAILSGPTFASEVARGLPTAVTVAGESEAVARLVALALGTPSFRPYVSDDPVGCAIGGAVKNVLAIACGIVWGRGLGENARAALITRGLAEMARLARAMGGRQATLMGLSGLGDLVLTCGALQSRNCSLGVALGQGQPLGAVLAERRGVTEGVTTAPAVLGLARRHGIEMPIVAAVDAILHQGAEIDATVRALLARPFRPEDRPEW